jgi:NAD(P) transhydrogenase
MFANEYDVVIIGGGPGGIVGAVTAATLGRRVALIDSHADLGGAGVNTGTVPSKTLRETALALSGLFSAVISRSSASTARNANW